MVIYTHTHTNDSQFISFEQSYPTLDAYIPLLIWNLHLDFSRIFHTYQVQDQIRDCPSTPKLFILQAPYIWEWHLSLYLIPHHSSPYSLALGHTCPSRCSSNRPCCLPQKDMLFSVSEMLPLLLSPELGFIFQISTQALLHRKLFQASQCTLDLSGICSHRTTSSLCFMKLHVHQSVSDSFSGL